MNAISRLFEVLRFSSPQDRPRRHRRRTRLHDRLMTCEVLEPKQLLAVDVANPFADEVLSSSTPLTIAITDQFDLNDVLGTVVKFETNAPIGSTSGPSTSNFYVELFDKPGAAATSTPSTVNNFLDYVSDGSYDNTMIHRSVENFVIQGGGFTTPTKPADESGSDPVLIQSKRFVPNEPGNSNRRGTIAMAKLPGNANSATSQWFFNLSDNTYLDTDNGGYAVFGKVLGDGMSVVDVMANAFTYDASLYYGYREGQGPFTDMPLWNYDNDNILKPEDPVNNRRSDFVEIDRIIQQTDESGLMTYSVTSSDSSKLAASINAQGDLVLTPVAGQTGSVSVTVTATSKLDNTKTASDTFAVGLAGGEPEDPVNPTPVLTPIESAGNTVLNKDANGKLYAGAVAMKSGGHSVGQLRGWTPIAAETVGGINYLAWQSSVSGSVSQWQMDANWSYEAYTAFSPGSPEFAQFEIAFNIDANDDGSVGSFRQLVTTDSGLVTLEVDSVTHNLYVGEALLTSGGTPLRANQLRGWTAIGAETVDGVNYLAWRNDSNGSISRWQMDANWAYQEYDSFYAGTTTFNEFEWDFGIDADGDSRRSIRGDAGSVLLQSHFSTRVLYVGDITLTSGGDPLRDNQLRGWTPIGAETVLGVNYLAWRNDSNGSISRWVMDANWAYQDFSSFSPGTPAFAQFEIDFDCDADSDGVKGSARQPIATDAGSVVLEVDLLTRILYVGDTALTSGTPLRDNQLSGWKPIAAETVDGVNYLAWQRITTNSISRWRMDTNWAYESFFAFSVGTTAYDDFELVFDIDADGDGSKG